MPETLSTIRHTERAIAEAFVAAASPDALLSTIRIRAFDLLAPQLPTSDEPICYPYGDLVQTLLEWSVDDRASPLRAGRAERRARGSFYTPPTIVTRTLSLASPHLPSRPLRICDPSCGSANFLVGAARNLTPSHTIQALEGADIDPLAAHAARAALAADPITSGINTSIRVGDAIIGRLRGTRHDPGLAAAIPAESSSTPLHWRSSFDLVIGNPPFLGQLGAHTARSRALAAYLRHASDELIKGYADTALAFLWRSILLAAPRGVIALILPRSILTARDAGPIRAFADAHAETLAMEPIDGAPFDAGVQTFILVMRKRAVARTPSREHPAWSLADRAQAPAPQAERTLAEICTATADFRDAYYGLQPFVIEDHTGALDEQRFPRLISCGSIEPGTSLWGRKPVRLYKQLWMRPRVNLDALRRQPDLRAWADRRLVPKILVATQTRAIEAVIDEHGRWLPITPVITVLPREGVSLSDLHRALSAPVASDAARRIAAGTGMSPHVVRLTARQIGQLPLTNPEDP